MDLSGLADIDVTALPEAELRQLLEDLQALEKAQLYGKFYTYFPDTGPLRRELYPKHLEFFAAGRDFTERLFMAANRVGKCRDYNALVPHPNGTVSTIGQLFDAAQAFDVWAWDGERAVAARASAVVRKPAEQCVELLLDNGASFTCSLEHRVLTGAGFDFVEGLLRSVPILPVTSEGRGLSARGADDRRWWRKALDSLDGCLTGRRPCDEQPRGDSMVVRALPPLQAGALPHNPASSPLDDLSHSSRRSPSRAFDLPSSRYARFRCAVLSAVFLARAAYRSDRHRSGSLPIVSRLHAGLASLARSLRAIRQGQSERQALVSPGMAANRVVAYRPAGIQPLYDMTVPGHHNYIADGIVHHNTEAGSYESTTHLAGIYPHWWEGRVFNRPIRMWAAGDFNETTRDVIQKKMLGSVEWHDSKKGVDGTGMIPRKFILQDTISWKAGVPDLIDTVRIDHQSLSGPIDGTSLLGFKSYMQGRRAFQGTEQDLIWCLAEGQLVQMADGRVIPIEQVRVGDSVLSINDKGRVVARKVLRTVDQGVKECVRVEAKHGTPIICTPDHDLYWGYRLASKAPAAQTKRVAQIRPGWWPEVTEDRSDAWYIWAALVVAEGWIAGRKVTNGNIAMMERAVAELPVGARARRHNFADTHKHVPDWHLYWDEFWEGWSTVLAHEKAIPDWVFTSSREKATLFLRWLFAGDGWASGKSIGYATTSERLACQIIILLNRLGVRATMSVRRSANVNWRDQYWVTVTRSSEVLKFLNMIGLEGKDAATAAVHAEATRRAASVASRGAHLHDPNRGPPKNKRKDVVFKSSPVRSITPAGEHRVFDITVENEHRFLAGTMLVSNCDEEPDMSVYGEMLIRLMTTKGLAMLTFTPLSGMSDVVKAFQAPEERELD